MLLYFMRKYKQTFASNDKKEGESHAKNCKT